MMIQAATFPPPLFGVVFGLAVSRICKKNKQTALVTPAGPEYTIITMCAPVFYRVFSFDLAPKLLANTVLPKRK